MSEQGDDSTPIHDKKFTLPSSSEDSLSATVTPVTTQPAAKTLANDQGVKFFDCL